MQTTGIFTTAEHRVSLKSMDDVVTFSPFGDVHREAEHHCERKWKEYLAYARDLERPVFVGIGDYHDFGSASERAAFKKMDLHSDTRRTITLRCLEEADRFVDEIAFMIPNLVGLAGGNHDMGLEQDGRLFTQTQYICEKLGVPFLGVACLMRLQLSCHGSVASQDVFLHHGKGGGATKGASLNTVDKMRNVARASIYCQGHNHDRGAWPVTTVRLDQNMKIVEEEQYLCRTGSFLKAYEPGSASYNVDACRAPSSLGWISLDLQMHRERGKDGRGLWVEKKAHV